MKKAMTVSLCMLTAAFAVHADTVIHQDDFSGYTGLLQYQGPWSAQNAFTNVPNVSATGGNEVLITGNWQRMVLAATEDGVNIKNLRPGDSVRVTLDHRYVSDWAGNYGTFEIVMTDTNANWYEGWRTNEGWPVTEPTIGMSSDYNNWSDGTYKYFPNKTVTDNANGLLATTPTYFGFQPNVGDATSDVVRITWTLTKSQITNQFETSVVFSNLTSSATLSKTAPNIVATNAWNDDNMYVMFKSVSPQGKCDIFFDSVKVEQVYKPQFRTAVEDDFSNPDYPLYGGLYAWQVAGIWNEGINNGTGYMVTNETARSQFGWRGIGSTTYSAVAVPEEIIHMEFDFKVNLGDTDGTYKLGDYMLVPDDGTRFTNSYNNAAISYAGYGTNGLNAQIEFNAWKGATGTEFPDGQINVKQGGNTWSFSDPSVLGLSPIVGNDWVSDNLHVTFSYLKSTNSGQWEAYATIENVDTATTFNSATNVIDRPLAWTFGTNLYPVIYQEGNPPPNGYYEFDNYKVIIEAEAPPVGYAGWTLNYPAVDLSDPYGDADSDGIDNVTEYALNGDPTVDVASDAGIVLPTMVYGADNNVNYYNLMRSDADADITYIVERKAALTDAAWISDTGWNLVQTNAYGLEGFDELHHRTWGGSKNEHFFRLRVIQN